MRADLLHREGWDVSFCNCTQCMHRELSIRQPKKKRHDYFFLTFKSSLLFFVPAVMSQSCIDCRVIDISLSRYHSVIINPCPLCHMHIEINFDLFPFLWTTASDVDRLGGEGGGGGGWEATGLKSCYAAWGTSTREVCHFNGPVPVRAASEVNCKRERGGGGLASPLNCGKKN